MVNHAVPLEGEANATDREHEHKAFGFYYRRAFWASGSGLRYNLAVRRWGESGSKAGEGRAHLKGL